MFLNWRSREREEEATNRLKSHLDNEKALSIGAQERSGSVGPVKRVRFSDQLDEIPPCNDNFALFHQRVRIDDQLTSSTTLQYRPQQSDFDWGIVKKESWLIDKRSRQMHERMMDERRKTRLCHQYSRTGSCRFGKRCRFAHSVQELELSPEPPNYKSKLCRFFEHEQWCPNHNACSYIHRRRN